MPKRPAVTPEFAPRDAYTHRLKRVRDALDRARLPALLVTNPLDIRYLTPFVGDDSYALVTHDQLWILSDARYEQDLVRAKKLARVHIRKGDMIDAVREVVASLRLRSLAVQPEHVSIALRARLGKALPRVRLKPLSGVFTSLRIIKDDAEAAFIRAAIAIQQDALLATLPSIRPGQSESAITARLEYEMKLRGSVKPAFDTIVAVGGNAAKPHAVPGHERSAKGRVVLIDWGARVGGYCSDMTRTFCLGRWPPKLADAYKLCLEAHMTGLAALAPGKTGREIDDAARRVIARSGMGKRFSHGLGHGIGLNIHEEPRLNRYGSDTILQPGMIVTIEPGLYLPGLAGIRIEDDALITERAAEPLCTLPKSLDWATL